MAQHLPSQRLIQLMALGIFTSLSASAQTLPIIPQDEPMTLRASRGGEAMDKLSPDLQILYKQFSRAAKEDGYPRYDEIGLQSLFGISDPRARNPQVGVVIRLYAGKSRADLPSTLSIKSTSTGAIFAETSVGGLESLAHSPAVEYIEAASTVAPPIAPPKDSLGSLEGVRGGTQTSNFDHQQLTGKGVIVAVVDSGIDFRNPDFINPDGSSRVLYLWDMFDESYATSGGKIGLAPPVAGGKGTLYKQSQLTAALKGTGTVNSKDIVGHGTQCAGTAAGNGRATANGIPAGSYMGVAPEADLVVVRVMDAHGSGKTGDSSMALEWVAALAKQLGKPCSINCSYGNHYNSHSGKTPQEKLVDNLVGRGKPGIALCAAAGNEGNYSFHASGVFGPNRPGQQDWHSSQIELFVKEETPIVTYFDGRDDWGQIIIGRDNFLVDSEGKPLVLKLAKAPGGTLSYGITSKGQHYEGPLAKNWKGTGPAPANLDAFINGGRVSVAHPQDPSEASTTVVLPPGSYWMLGYSTSPNVSNGHFDVYDISGAATKASFGTGTDRHCMVGSPGAADNAICVGSYNFRTTWVNSQNANTYYNLPLGEASGYSSPGYRRDGVVKPEILAPATYTISSRSRDADPAPESEDITKDGFHSAWAGTSAATPYTAGLVALMLECDPRLDAAAIKTILTRTATHDANTGATPNAKWGYGKLDPVAALRMVRKRPH